MGCTQNKNHTSIEDVEKQLAEDIPFLINGIIDLTYYCFDSVSRDYRQIKRFGDIQIFILTDRKVDNLHFIHDQLKLSKKFNNIILLFNILVNNKVTTHAELHEFFVFSLREKIRHDIKSQFSQYNLSVLNTLLHRFKYIYPEK